MLRLCVFTLIASVVLSSASAEDNEKKSQTKIFAGGSGVQGLQNIHSAISSIFPGGRPVSSGTHGRPVSSGGFIDFGTHGSQGTGIHGNQDSHEIHHGTAGATVPHGGVHAHGGKVHAHPTGIHAQVPGDSGRFPTGGQQGGGFPIGGQQGGGFPIGGQQGGGFPIGGQHGGGFPIGGQQGGGFPIGGQHGGGFPIGGQQGGGFPIGGQQGGGFPIGGQQGGGFPIGGQQGGGFPIGGQQGGGFPIGGHQGGRLPIGEQQCEGIFTRGRHDGGFSIGGYQSGTSSGCRYWCKTPDQRFYCCEKDSERPSSVTCRRKQGSCPPLRPCPGIKTGPPRTCSNDCACPGNERCCFDCCLGVHVCKSTVSNSFGSGQLFNYQRKKPDRG